MAPSIDTITGASIMNITGSNQFKPWYSSDGNGWTQIGNNIGLNEKVLNAKVFVYTEIKFGTLDPASTINYSSNLGQSWTTGNQP